MYHVCLCYAVMYSPCSLVVTCWLSSVLCFLHGVLGQVWYLIVSIPDLCLPFYVDDIMIDHTKYMVMAFLIK